MKQRNGFPPNFVHSLDSTHMMLTSLYLWSHGCTYASVHDCYWTHASTVDIMNKVCRDQFVNMHSYPILGKLSEKFKQRYLDVDAHANSDITDKQLAAGSEMFSVENNLKQGTLDLNVVKDSVFFFS